MASLKLTAMDRANGPSLRSALVQAEPGAGGAVNMSWFASSVRETSGELYWYVIASRCPLSDQSPIVISQHAAFFVLHDTTRGKALPLDEASKIIQASWGVPLKARSSSVL